MKIIKMENILSQEKKLTPRCLRTQVFKALLKYILILINNTFEKYILTVIYIACNTLHTPMLGPYICMTEYSIYDAYAF